MNNPMAEAWLQAGNDLEIRVVHPFTFLSKSGVRAETQGVFLPDFGCDLGMLLTCRFDSDEICDAADDTDYRLSGLNPNTYEPYDRQLYIQTLSDWGWFGDGTKKPSWYDPEWRAKL